MGVSNDPRFFSDNVLNYRIAAFSGIGVVSGLLTQNAMDYIFDMDKRMDPRTWNGALQLVSFSLLNVVLYCNMIATYIGVAQPYHTFRLMTAGPTGFECAKSYYLEKHIIAWRHIAIKAMLLSLPVFITSQGLRLVVKFDRGTKAEPEDLPLDKPPFYSIVEGTVFGVLMVLMGLLLIGVHYLHFSVFASRYKTLYYQPTEGVYSVVGQQELATVTRTAPDV